MAYLQDISIQRVTPLVLPLPLSEVKSYLRVDYNDDDAQITSLIWTAIDCIERYCGRVFANSTCKAFYYQDGGDKVVLYYADNIELIPGSKYEVKGGAIYTEDKEVEIEYSAGYPNDELPFWAKSAIKANVAYRYTNRGDMAIDITQIDNETKSILTPHVKWSLI